MRVASRGAKAPACRWIEAYVLAGELHRADGDFRRAFAAYETRLRSFVTAKQQAAIRFRWIFHAADGTLTQSA